MAVQGRGATEKSLVQYISISSLTQDVIQQFAPEMESRQIRVDSDLDDLSADVFPRLIHSAVAQMIERAVEATPDGGELNVTLIDSGSCWELEVADSMNSDQEHTELGANADDPRAASPADRVAPNQPAAGLPAIMPLDQRSRLEMACRAAVVHGGQMQTLDCPQGGTANVLVIPRRQETRRAA